MERKPKRKTKYPSVTECNLAKSASMQGNLFREKFKTPEERYQLFDAVCVHLEKGLSRESFPLCDWDTVERYVSKYANEFPADIVREAMRRGRLWWEELGRIGTMGGKVNGERVLFNAQSWAFNMKNRYGWKDSMNVINTIEGGVLLIPEPLDDAQFELACQQMKKKQAEQGGMIIDGTATNVTP